ncbi:MAG: WbqC family protein, partial [Janthinobacterium lividum]
QALFDAADFARHGVALHFAETRPFAYPTPGAGFVPDLSILDVLLWNTPEQVLAAVRGCVSISSA